MSDIMDYKEFGATLDNAIIECQSYFDIVMSPLHRVNRTIFTVIGFDHRDDKLTIICEALVSDREQRKFILVKYTHRVDDILILQTKDSLLQLTINLKSFLTNAVAEIINSLAFNFDTTIKFKDVEEDPILERYIAERRHDEFIKYCDSRGLRILKQKIFTPRK